MTTTVANICYSICASLKNLIYTQSMHKTDIAFVISVLDRKPSDIYKESKVMHTYCKCDTLEKKMSCADANFRGCMNDMIVLHLMFLC